MANTAQLFLQKNFVLIVTKTSSHPQRTSEIIGMAYWYESSVNHFIYLSNFPFQPNYCVAWEQLCVSLNASNRLGCVSI